MDPDQLVSSGSTLFSIEFISGFILFVSLYKYLLKGLYFCP